MIAIFTVIIVFEWDRLDNKFVWLPVMCVRYVQDFFLVYIVYFMKEDKQKAAGQTSTREFFLSKCFLIPYFLVSLGITAYQIVNIFVIQEDIYDHIVFSVFVRFDLCLHGLAYLSMLADTQTYGWYLFNWKRRYYLRKALIKRISKNNKESVINS